MNTICGIGAAPSIGGAIFYCCLVHGSLMYKCYLCLVMARGLSDLQKSILVIVNDQPGGGGYLTDINKQIKSSLFPDTWGKYIRSHGIYLKEHYSWRQGEGYGRVVNGTWKADLEGFTIALISDLHLAGFYNHQKFLKKQMEVINSYSPDIVVNSGDFVSYGWRESNGMDTILAVAYGRLGNYAVFGNHDMGTYLPAADYTERESNILMIRDFIHKAGYQLLTDNNVIIRKGEASVSIAGITTRGRHGHIKYGNLSKALEGTENADFRILISHDPNHWRKEVAGKTGVDLTLAGHTHGMQIGIFTKKFRWSPSRYFYPEWGGLYHEGGQWLYVNRGLGVLGIPFRIWMPPEITIIRLTGNLQQKAISSF